MSNEENDRICRVGPGTPMGSLMRQYWVPAMLSSELPHPDCDPVRVKLLGEELVAFRDTSGQIGLIQNRCPHRGASLFYGRNEDGGLRCVYHGWKFGVQGQCFDMPLEPPESTYKDKVRARAYPCVERNGLVWSYLGPRAEPPPLPDIEANQPNEEFGVRAALRECNWLQALEGDIDTGHFTFLHFGSASADEMPKGSFMYYQMADRSPRYAVLDTTYGCMYGAYRPASEGKQYWRIAQFLFPFYAQIPTGVLGHQIVTRAWVPMDDTHTMFFGMERKNRPRPALEGRVESEGRRRAVLMTPLAPQTTDWYGRFRLEADGRNDYHIDREWQRESDYTGIDGIHTQDQAVTESMGPVFDRTDEHLGSSDAMVIRVRRRLLAAVDAWTEKGIVPPGAEDPDVYRTRSGGVILDEGVDWVAATEQLRQAYVEHPDLDLSLDGIPSAEKER